MAATTANLCGDTMIGLFADTIRQAGGTVHDALVLLVGELAEYGQVSLAGVGRDDLSLCVPKTLGEWPRKQGIWCEFLKGLGYTLNRAWWDANVFDAKVYPVIGAANHNSDPDTQGRIVEQADCFELYGTDFCYTPSRSKLANVYGITD